MCLSWTYCRICLAGSVTSGSRSPIGMSFFSVSNLNPDPSIRKICVVLPTRNEAATIASVSSTIRRAFSENGLREPVILLSDDSHDQTRAIAQELGRSEEHTSELQSRL